MAIFRRSFLQRLAACLFAVVATLAVPPARAVPAFTAVDLGFGIPLDVNNAGLILGLDGYAGTQPWVSNGSTKAYLPLPAGTTAASAARIGESGAVVGQVGSQAAVWWPQAGGGRLLDLLPFPPGATVGSAVAVNGSDTVLVSYGTPTTLATGLVVWSYKPWLYRRDTGLVDAAPGQTSLATAVDLNDAGRILLQSGEIVEPGGALSATPPFPAPPPGGYHWIALRAARLNAGGAMTAVAVLSSSIGYAQVVRHVPGQGWQTLGGLSLSVQALGIDRAADVLMMANWVCPNAFGLGYNLPGAGTYCLSDLVLGGGWSFESLSARGALASGDDATSPGGIVALGYNVAAGAWRLARLVPAGQLPPPPAVALTATPHPGTWQQPYDAITLRWTSAGTLARGYVIERRDPGAAAFAEIARISASYAQYDDTAVTPLASYAYRIAALGLGGQGAWSNTATAQAPAPMDRTAPTVVITAPTEGATVSGQATVSATFTDDVGVTSAQLSFAPASNSGVICNRAATTVAKTWTVSCRWDTRQVANRSPTATVTAYGQDAIGNWVQQSVNVNVTYGKGRGR